jgi:hypothetical protein
MIFSMWIADYLYVFVHVFHSLYYVYLLNAYISCLFFSSIFYFKTDAVIFVFESLYFEYD